MNKYQQKHRVILSKLQKNQLQDITHKGRHNAREIKRAQVLLKSADGKKDATIGADVGMSTRTVERIRARFTNGGMKRAIADAPRSGQPPALDDKGEAHLVAIACSDPPEGRDRWTIELLQQRMIQDGKVREISTVTVWNYLTKRGIKPWREKNVVYPEPHA